MSTAKRRRERWFVDQLIAKLQWEADVVEGDDPPDFVLNVSGQRVSVEVRQIFSLERRRGGSPAAEREASWNRFLRRLMDEYYENDGIPSRVMFFSVDAPDGLRELEKWLAAAKEPSLRAIRNLVRSTPVAEQRKIRLKVCHRPLDLWVTRLPSTPEYEAFSKRWKAMNNQIGWGLRMSAADLQWAIDEKARILAKYRKNYSQNVLLLVADAMTASGFIYPELEGEVDPKGFDEIYFLKTLDRAMKIYPPVDV